MPTLGQPQQRTDITAFLIAVLLGAMAIIGLRPLGVPQLAVTLVVCALVVGYSFLVALTGQLRLRLDQAGDNAYYLGLVFTLMSMMRALWEVGEAARTTQTAGASVAEIVIGDFGIALSSTLVGIICRLILQQMRQDPHEVERAARMELAEAATRMKAKLTEASTSIGEFHEGLRQRHSDYVEEVGARYKAVSQEAALQLETISGQSIKAIQSTSEAFSSATAAATSELANAMGMLREAIDAFARAPGEAGKALESALEALRSVTPPPARLGRRYDELAQHLGGASALIESSGRGLAENIEQLKRAAEAFSGAMTAMEQTGARSLAREIERDGQLTETLREHASQLQAIEAGVVSMNRATSELAAGARDSRDAVVILGSEAKNVLDGLTDAVDAIGRKVRQP